MTNQVYVLGQREPVQVDTPCPGHDDYGMDAYCVLTFCDGSCIAPPRSPEALEARTLEILGKEGN